MRLALKNLSLTALLLVALFAPLRAQAQGKNAKLHQCVAGVSKYAPDSGQRNLTFAHKDADDMAAFWRQHGSAMFSSVHGAALLDEKATRANILARLDAIVEEARSADWVVIFLAGHGGPYFGRDGKEWRFCAHDAVIRDAELQQRITRLADKQVTVLLILDCCFSGMMATPGTKAIVMAACRDDEASNEFAVLRNGQFTQALLAGLAGQAKLSKDGRITLASLRTYVTKQVGRCSDNRQVPLFWVPDGVRDDLPMGPVAAVPAASNLSGPTGLTAEKVAALLKSKGHKAEVMPKGPQQGKSVAAVIVEDDWRYEVTISFSTDERGVWFATPLRPAEGLGVQQLQALMKTTSDLGCMDVFTVDGQGKLCLETPNTRIAAAAPFSLTEVFFQKLNRHLRTIRDSHDVWKMPTTALTTK
jgi:hypothetical protein